MTDRFLLSAAACALVGSACGHEYACEAVGAVKDDKGVCGCPAGRYEAHVAIADGAYSTACVSANSGTASDASASDAGSGSSGDGGWQVGPMDSAVADADAATGPVTEKDGGGVGPVADADADAATGPVTEKDGGGVAPVDAGSTHYDWTSTPGVVTDSSTGLRWQRVLPAAYAGCTKRARGDSGQVGDACTWAEAQAYCDGLTLAASSDWRLPTKMELESIVDSAQLSPNLKIDLAAFPNTQSTGSWTASLYMGGSAWYVDFFYGLSYHDVVSDWYSVRCVR